VDGWFESDAEEPVCFVWKENWRVVRAFQEIGWDIYVGQFGVVYERLRYEDVPRVMRLLRIPRRKELEVTRGLQVMDKAAREILNANPKK
jgi:hypothetical protein